MTPDQSFQVSFTLHFLFRRARAITFTFSATSPTLLYSRVFTTWRFSRRNGNPSIPFVSLSLADSRTSIFAQATSSISMALVC
jgi:hypothetical protein